MKIGVFFWMMLIMINIKIFLRCNEFHQRYVIGEICSVKSRNAVVSSNSQQTASVCFNIGDIVAANSLI